MIKGFFVRKDAIANLIERLKSTKVYFVGCVEINNWPIKANFFDSLSCLGIFCSFLSEKLRHFCAD